MEYKFNKVHRDTVRQEASDGLSRLPVEGTDDCDINDDISAMAIAIRAYSRLREVTDTTLDKTLIMTNVPDLPTTDELFLCTKQGGLLRQNSTHLENTRILIQFQSK